VAGARDFPLIKRYEGSRLIGYDSRSFDTVKLLLGKLKLGDNGQPAVDAVREVGRSAHKAALPRAARAKRARSVSQL